MRLTPDNYTLRQLRAGDIPAEAPARATPGTSAGFTLIQAIFIVVVLGLLGSFMVAMFQVQTLTPTLANQGIRGYYAAKSGLEWGKNHTLSNDACFADDTLNLDTFQVEMSCQEGNYTEGSKTYKWFRLKAIAEHGSPGDMDYARRKATMQLVSD